MAVVGLTLLKWFKKFQGISLHQNGYHKNYISVNSSRFMKGSSAGMPGEGFISGNGCAKGASVDMGDPVFFAGHGFEL
jgi:hypothetical protein